MVIARCELDLVRENYDAFISRGRPYLTCSRDILPDDDYINKLCNFELVATLEGSSGAEMQLNYLE